MFYDKKTKNDRKKKDQSLKDNSADKKSMRSNNKNNQPTHISHLGKVPQNY